MQIDYTYPKEIDIRGYKPTVEGHIGQIKKAIKLLQSSKRPLICAGGGVILGEAKAELKEFIEASQLPLVHTLMGVGALPTKNPQNYGMVGSHGFKQANWALKSADTILFIGARIADRAVANVGILDENANIIHIDVDPAEIGKITSANIPIVGDARHILKHMTELIKPADTKDWCQAIEDHRLIKEEVHPYDVSIQS